MKKIKGALTTTERQVVKNKKTIVVLIIVLVISIAINVIFVTGISDSIFKYRIVKVEESVEIQQVNGDSEKVENEESSNAETTAGEAVADENNDVEDNGATDEITEVVNEENEGDEVSSESEIKVADEITSFDSESMLEALYSYDDDEFKKALKENYDNAKAISVDFEGCYRFIIKYDKEIYTFYDYNNYVEFEANNRECKFTKEKIEGLYELIEKNKLKICGLKSYVNADGLVIDITEPRSYIYGPGGDYNSYTYYPPENMEEIVEYCRNLKNIMLENK